MRIAIIGGGTAGLAAAYELQKARDGGAAIEYALFEARSRLGGAMASEIVDGAVLERGPDSFLTEKPAAAELCRELGLGSELLPSNDAGRKTYVVVRNRLVALPDGLMFLVPTQVLATALSPLFSFSTKVRMALELLHSPRRPSTADETVAAFVERHFGAEVVDRLADPLLSGVYGGDSAQLSVRTVLPRLVEIESRYGSLTRGVLAAHRGLRARAAANGHSSSPAPSIFTTLRGGMQLLVDALVARIDPHSVRLDCAVSSLEKTAGGWRVRAGSAAETFDALIVASPAWAAGLMLRSSDPALADDLCAIPYSSSIIVNLIYEEAKLGRLPTGFGFLVPAVEGRSMLACTFAHRKFIGRTPPGKAVFRAFLGGIRRESLPAESDEKVVSTVRRELGEILGSSIVPPALEPEYVQITRWPRAMAQYTVGHKERVERIAARAAALGGLQLAGNAYDGIGVPDCIRLGRKAARELIARAREESALKAGA
jgi:oxygen-dependent protoporphyrinogen oxidase